VAVVAYLQARIMGRDEPETIDLVAEALRGNAEARRSLYDRYQASVNRTAARVAIRPDDVDDLVQDAFVLAFERLERLRDRAAFGAWVRSIVIRLAAKRLRRHRLARRLGLVEAAVLTRTVAVVPGESATEAALVLEETVEALAQLPGQAGEALYLHRIEGMTVPQLARHLGVSEPTVKRRLARACSELEALR